LGDETSVSEQKGVNSFRKTLTLGYLFFVFSALINAKKLSKNEHSKVKRWKMVFG